MDSKLELHGRHMLVYQLLLHHVFFNSQLENDLLISGFSIAVDKEGSYALHGTRSLVPLTI